MTEPGSEFIHDEKDMRRRMRHALRELALLASHRNLIYRSEDEYVELADVKGLAFEVYNNYDDGDEEPTYISADTTDEQLK
jgi:hypothetical protein